MTEASPTGKSKEAVLKNSLSKRKEKRFSNLQIPRQSDEVLVVENYANLKQDSDGKSPNSPKSPVSSAKRKPSQGGILVSKDSSKGGLG